MKFSVNEHDLQGVRVASLPDTDTGFNMESSFTWTTIVSKYKSRKTECIAMNIFKFLSFASSKKQKIPQFFDFNNRPSWPLNDIYCQWMLTLYKPWLKSHSETMISHSSYKIALQDYMWDKEFPRSILLDILQCKINLDERVDLD